MSSRRIRSISLFLVGASLPFVLHLDRSLMHLVQFDTARSAQMTIMVPQKHVEHRVEPSVVTESLEVTTNETTLPPVTSIYCVCPAGSQTGGPEALHQLCKQINLSDAAQVNASMLYVKTQRRNKNKTAVHVADAIEPRRYMSLYHSQVAHESNPLKDDSSPDKLLIWPEIMVNEMMEYLRTTPNPCQCAIYWLSVDKFSGNFTEWQNNRIVHLAQSEYARRFVLEHGATNVFPLKEYIPRIPKRIPKGKRPIDVIYNPKKGIDFTKAIMERSASVFNFQAIAPPKRRRRRKESKLSPEQVQNLLRQSKVYIDFGDHPGMDRIPREAALAGCVVVTNRAGSARFREDVPIPSQYKVEHFDVDAIHELLLDIVNNYETHNKQFRRYRVWIRGQRKRMKQHVAAFLKEVVENRKVSAEAFGSGIIIA